MVLLFSLVFAAATLACGSVAALPALRFSLWMLSVAGAHAAQFSALRARYNVQTLVAQRGGGRDGALPAGDQGAAEQQSPHSEKRGRQPAPEPTPAFDARGLEIRRALLEAETADKLLRESELIPAIRGNFDGALRITRATLDDARLACLAIYRLAALAAVPMPPRPRRPFSRSVQAGSGGGGGGSGGGGDFYENEYEEAAEIAELMRQRALTCAGDPRFGQLIEVVECQLAELELSDLSKVVYGLAMLNQRRDGLLDRLTRHAAERCAAIPPLAPASAAPSATAASEATTATSVAVSETERELQLEEGDAAPPPNDVGRSAAGAAASADAAELQESSAKLAGSASNKASERKSSGDAVSADCSGAARDQLANNEHNKAAEEANENTDESGKEIRPGQEQQQQQQQEEEKDTSQQREEARERKQAEEEAAAAAAAAAELEEQRFTQQQQLISAELATTAVAFGHACARLGYPSASVFEAIVTPLASRVEFLPFREISSVAWAYGTARQGAAAPLMNALAQQIMSLPPRALSGRELAGICWTYASLKIQIPGFFEKLAAESLPTIPSMAEHDVAHLAWGLAKAALSLGDLSGEIVPLVAELYEGAPAEAVGAEEARGAADAKTTSKPTSDEPIDHHATPKTTTVASAEEAAAGKPAEIAEPSAAEVLSEVAAALLERAEERFALFKPKHLARLVWAFATWHEQGLKISGSAELAARTMAEAGRGPRDAWAPDDLAQVVWAFATLVGNDDSPAQDLAVCLGRVAALFESEVSSFDPPTLCDVLWALAAVRHPAHALAEAVGEALLGRVEDLPLPSVASLAWAHARIGHPAAELMERVLRVVEHKLGEFSTKDAAAVMWALGALGHTVTLKAPLYLQRESLRELNPSAVANLLWGIARTGAAQSPDFNPEILAVLSADLGPKLLSCSHHELCRVIWALAQLQHAEINPKAREPGSEPSAESSDRTAAAAAVAAEAANGGPSAAAAAAAEAAAAAAAGGAVLNGKLLTATPLADRVVSELCKWVEIMSAQEVADVLWALCRLRLRVGRLTQLISKDLRRRRDGLPALVRAAAAAAAAGGNAAAGATAQARAKAFELGRCQHWLEEHENLGLDDLEEEGRQQAGMGLLSRVFGESHD